MNLDLHLSELIRQIFREELASSRHARDLELLTADDVARLLKYSNRHSVYKLIREGKLKPLYLGEKTLRFTRTEVQRFIEECTHEDKSHESL